MKFTQNDTQRGFARYNFNDLYGAECSIQQSSLATDDAIWLGIDDPDPKILACDARKLGMEPAEPCGWLDYPIPDEVLLTTRMHLNQDQARDLARVLLRFARTGQLECPTIESCQSKNSESDSL